MAATLAGRTAGEQHCDLLHHPSGQFAILLSPPLGSAHPCDGAFIGIFYAFLFGLLQRGPLHQDALPFVASP
jgi:hypothetical protein